MDFFVSYTAVTADGVEADWAVVEAPGPLVSDKCIKAVRDQISEDAFPGEEVCLIPVNIQPLPIGAPHE